MSTFEVNLADVVGVFTHSNLITSRK